VIQVVKAQSDDETVHVSKFKVEFTQSGKYLEYIRFLTLGSGMVVENSSKEAVTLMDDDLKLSKYTFVSTDSLEVFQPAIQVGWYGNKKGTGQVELKVFRDGSLIDTQIVYLKPENDGQVKNLTWSYKAK